MEEMATFAPLYHNLGVHRSIDWPDGFLALPARLISFVDAEDGKECETVAALLLCVDFPARGSDNPPMDGTRRLAFGTAGTPPVVVRSLRSATEACRPLGRAPPADGEHALRPELGWFHVVAAADGYRSRADVSIDPRFGYQQSVAALMPPTGPGFLSDGGGLLRLRRDRQMRNGLPGLQAVSYHRSQRGADLLRDYLLYLSLSARDAPAHHPRFIAPKRLAAFLSERDLVGQQKWLAERCPTGFSGALALLLAKRCWTEVDVPYVVELWDRVDGDRRPVASFAVSGPAVYVQVDVRGSVFWHEVEPAAARELCRALRADPSSLEAAVAGGEGFLSCVGGSGGAACSACVGLRAAAAKGARAHAQSAGTPATQVVDNWGAGQISELLLRLQLSASPRLSEQQTKEAAAAVRKAPPGARRRKGRVLPYARREGIARHLAEPAYEALRHRAEKWWGKGSAGLDRWLKEMDLWDSAENASSGYHPRPYTPP